MVSSQELINRISEILVEIYALESGLKPHTNLVFRVENKYSAGSSFHHPGFDYRFKFDPDEKDVFLLSIGRLDPSPPNRPEKSFTLLICRQSNLRFEIVMDGDFKTITAIEIASAIDEFYVKQVIES